jgi:hypothetical protein
MLAELHVMNLIYILRSFKGKFHLNEVKRVKVKLSSQHYAVACGGVYI